MTAESSRHRIRLAGPWMRWSDDPDAAEPVTVPEQLSPIDPDDPSAGEGQTVFYRRRFNCPSGLSADTQLFLLFQNADHVASVKLNDRPVTLQRVDGDLRRVKVDDLLPGSNRIELELGGPQRQLTGQVFLEIIEPA